MELENQILEIMLNLAEEENADLKDENAILKSEIEYLQAMISFLEGYNEEMAKSIDRMLDINKRLN